MMEEDLEPLGRVEFDHEGHHFLAQPTSRASLAVSRGEAEIAIGPIDSIAVSIDGGMPQLSDVPMTRGLTPTYVQRAIIDWYERERAKGGQPG
jgi:hypothetical protein